MSTQESMVTVDEVENAERALRQLETEREQLPAAIADAAREIDTEQLRNLKHRAGDIDIDIYAARARALKLKLAQRESEHAREREQLATIKDELVSLSAWVDEAGREHLRRLDVYGEKMTEKMGIENGLQNLHEEIRDLRRELEALPASMVE